MCRLLARLVGTLGGDPGPFQQPFQEGVQGTAPCRNRGRPWALKLHVELIHDLIVKVHVGLRIPPVFLVGPDEGAHLGDEVPDRLRVVMVRGSQLVEILVYFRQQASVIQVGFIQDFDRSLHRFRISCPDVGDLILGRSGEETLQRDER